MSKPVRLQQLRSTGSLPFGSRLSGSNVLSIQGSGRLINGGTINISGLAAGLDVTGTTKNNAGATINLTNKSGSTFTGNVTNSGTFEPTSDNSAERRSRSKEREEHRPILDRVNHLGELLRSAWLALVIRIT